MSGTIIFMKGFAGFPEGKVRSVAVPEPFFTELLPSIDHLGELKVTLYAVWRLSFKEGRYRYLRRDDFSTDETFMRGLAVNTRAAEELLDEALERAEARGALLAVVVEDAQTTRQLYFMNTALGREALDQLTRGQWRPPEAEGAVVTLSQMRSSLFVLYEQNIGLLTPMLAEELRDLQADYPAEWIEDAIRIAARNNARRLKYIQAVLKRMQTEGAHAQEDRSDPEANLRRYDGYRPFLDDEPAG